MYAKYADETGDFSVLTTAEYNEAGKIWTYSMLLPKAGECEIWAERDCDSLLSIAWRSEPVTVTVAETFETIGKALVMKPVLDHGSDEDGRIELRFQDETKDQKVSTIDFYIPEVNISYEIKLHDDNENNDTTSIDLPTGNYDATITCFDADGKELYSTHESINVLSGFVTDTWYGKPSYIKSDDSGSYYAIIDEMINSYSKTGNLSYPVILYNQIESEKKLVESSLSSEIYKFESEGTYQNGVQIFGYGNVEGAEITRVDADSLRFAIDGNKVYFLNKTDEYPYRYTIDVFKESYSRYVKEAETIDIDELTTAKVSEMTFYSGDTPIAGSEITAEAVISINAFTVCNGYIYYLFNFYNGSYSYFVGAMEISDNSNILVWKEPDGLDVHITSGEYDNFPIQIYCKDDLKYLIFAKADSIYKVPFTQTEESLVISTDADSFKTIFTNNTGTMSDFIVMGDKLYILAYLFSSYISPAADSNFHYYYDKDTESYSKQLEVVSTGGIACIDLTTDTRIKLFGNDYYGTYTDFTYTYSEDDNEYIKGVSGYEVQPPYNQKNDYFYGPKRFIGKKPDELIIADDGIYVLVEDDGTKKTLKEFKNMNRVVTVDLSQSYSLSVVDVNVSFSSTIQKATDSDFNITD